MRYFVSDYEHAGRISIMIIFPTETLTHKNNMRRHRNALIVAIDIQSSVLRHSPLPFIFASFNIPGIPLSVPVSRAIYGIPSPVSFTTAVGIIFSAVSVLNLILEAFSA